jgi:hypothetical protein
MSTGGIFAWKGKPEEKKSEARSQKPEVRSQKLWSALPPPPNGGLYGTQFED